MGVRALNAAKQRRQIHFPRTNVARDQRRDASIAFNETRWLGGIGEGKMSARWKLTQFVRLFHTVKGMRACDKLCRKNMCLKSILVPTLYK